MTNKDILKIALNLVIIYVAGGLVLAGIYATTSPIIFKNNEKAKQEALKKLIPEADAVVKAGDWTIHGKHAEYYEAKKGNETLGYIVQSFGKGYSSYINTLIAVDRDMKIKKITILGHGETPGLGDEIEYDSFTDQFKSKGKDQMKVLKTETKDYIQALSGATISTRAVAEDAVKNGLGFLTEKYKGGSSDGTAPR